MAVSAPGELSLLSRSAPGLGVEKYAGLSIAGPVGAVYLVESIATLEQAGDRDAWQAVALVQLATSPQLWIDPSGPAVGGRFYRATRPPLPVNMVFIPPGRFRMGCPGHESDGGEYERPETVVTISQGFWMGRCEVTEAEYTAAMGFDPSWFKGSADLPVERVTWYDAKAYCQQRSRLDRERGLISRGMAYRLPTEAEWEYACRAWTSTRFSHGDDAICDALAKYGWYGENAGFATRPVGERLPNPWGLNDMHGNVREWCEDWFDTYPGGSAVDPRGPATGTYRVVRGGGWADEPCCCRSATRGCTDPASGSYDLGFRVVLAPVRPGL